MPSRSPRSATGPRGPARALLDLTGHPFGPQRRAAQLPRGVTWQTWDELHRLGHLRAGQRRPAVGAKSLGVETSEPCLDDGVDPLAPAVVGQADHGHIDDIRVAQDRRLHLHGVDVDPPVSPLGQARNVRLRLGDLLELVGGSSSRRGCPRTRRARSAGGTPRPAGRGTPPGPWGSWKAEWSPRHPPPDGPPVVVYIDPALAPS